MNREPPYRLNIEEIKNYLPHRAPFLLVDRVVSIEPKGDLSILDGSSDKVGTRVLALKNISFGESAFQGHFPNRAIFPGVLTIEALAQAAGFAAYPFVIQDPKNLENGLIMTLASVDDARFRRPVVPGDALYLDIELIKCRRSLWQFSAKAKVDDQLVAECILMAQLLVKKADTALGEAS